MKLHPLHSWDLTPAEAVGLQRQLAARIDTHTPLRRCDLVAGADVAYHRHSDTVHAGVVVLRAADWSVVEQQSFSGRVTFPYVPGLLSFREAPVLLEAFARIQYEPDLIMLDGQGVAHPRRFGLACHLGLWLDRPCLGCAKSRFCGYFKDLDRKAGATAPLIDQGEVVGQAVRTRTEVQPVFVSAGHKIDLASAVQWVLAAAQQARVPEPTRHADMFVNALRRAARAAGDVSA